MSTPINDGGPAFPFGTISEITGHPINGYFSAGMTLRDFFAAASLAGSRARNSIGSISEHYADTAYRDADEMLKRRVKGGAS